MKNVVAPFSQPTAKNRKNSIGINSINESLQFGHQLGGTNCTAAVTNFERSSDCYSDSYSECQPEPDRGTCSVSE